MRITTFVLTGLIACAAAPALAAEPAPAVSVRGDDTPGEGVVAASVIIAASPEAVWAVMTDCHRLARLMTNVDHCRVMQRDPAGRWDVREQVTKASLLPAARTVLRSDYDEPRLVRFHRIDGDFKVLEGEWRLTAMDGGARTRVDYVSRMSSPVAAPGLFVRMAMRGALTKTLTNLRDACEAGVLKTALRP
jgi:ribosome-associated toxin RatA of RatAB toxin-antitoxin module